MTLPDHVELSLETARALAIRKQGLQQRPAEVDKPALLKLIQQIGLLQLDTINVVARSHYLVMLSRLGLYQRAWLDELLYPDRLLFEQWAHAACLIPAAEYAYFAPVIEARRRQPIGNWQEERLGGDPEAVLEAVLAEIRERGALASRHFADEREQRGTWWNRKPAKHALDLLYSRGDLMVDRRENFQVYYDLAERVLPASAAPITKTVDDYRRWALQRGLGCLGVATISQICDYYRLKKSEVRSLLPQLLEEGELLAAAVPEWQEQAYICPADLALVDRIEQGLCQSDITTFLTPFDNLTWNRDRLKELFGFDYKLEIYVPSARRKHGYYVMPILHHGRFVGRIDPKAERQTKTMIIRNVYLEPGEKVSEQLLLGLAGALAEFMLFHGSQSLVVENSEPRRLRQALQRAVSRST